MRTYVVRNPQAATPRPHTIGHIDLHTLTLRGLVLQVPPPCSSAAALTFSRLWRHDSQRTWPGGHAGLLRTGPRNRPLGVAAVPAGRSQDAGGAHRCGAAGEPQDQPAGWNLHHHW